MDGKFFFNVDVSAEVSIISGNEVTSSSLCSCIFDNHWAIDLVRVFDNLWHCAASALQPLALQSTAAFPVQDVTIAKGWNIQTSEVCRSEIFDQRTMWNKNHVLFTKPFCMVKHFTIVIQHEPFVRICSREGLVEATAIFSDRDAEGFESLLTGTVEDLKRGVRGNDTNGYGVFIIVGEPILHCF